MYHPRYRRRRVWQECSKYKIKGGGLRKEATKNGYLISNKGESIMMEKIKSRKFILVVATALLAIANDGLGLGLDDVTILKVVGIVTGYVLGQGYVDGQKEKAKGGN